MELYGQQVSRAPDTLEKLLNQVRQLRRLFLTLCAALLRSALPCKALQVFSAGPPQLSRNVYRFYCAFWRSYGEHLAKMQQRGIHIDVDALEERRLSMLQNESTRSDEASSRILDMLKVWGETQRNSRIHPAFTLGSTGQVASQNPNLRYIAPLEKYKLCNLRSIFTAPAGKRLIVADYCELELRVLAHVSGCPSLRVALQSGADVHARTAQDVLPRVPGKPLAPQMGKTFFPGPSPQQLRRAMLLDYVVLYGKSPQKLAELWGVPLEYAEGAIQAWFRDHPEVVEWKKRLMKRAQTEHCVRTILGRPIWSPSLLTIPEKCLFAVLRGSAADIVMLAVLELKNSHALQKLGAVMVAQVSSLVMFEVPSKNANTAVALVKKIMESPARLKDFSTPLRVNVKAGVSWEDGQ